MAAVASSSAPVAQPTAPSTESKTYIPPFMRGVPRSANGIAPVKAEYLLQAPPPAVRDDDAAESGTNPAQVDAIDDRDGKRQRTDEAGGFKKLSKEEKKARKGANKGRRFKALHDEVQVCFQYANRSGCGYGDSCKMSHDLEGYLKSKLKDIYFPAPSNSSYVGEPPYPLPPHPQNPFVVLTPTAEDNGETKTESAHANPNADAADESKSVFSSFDPTTTCPVYESLGYCPQAWKCRFLGGHVEKIADETSHPPVQVQVDGETRWVPPASVCGWRLKVDEEKRARVEREGNHGEMNVCRTDELRLLTKRIFKFPLSEAYLKTVDPESIKYLYPKPDARDSRDNKRAPKAVAAAEMDEEAMMNAMEGVEETTPAPAQREAAMAGAEADKDDVPMRPAEKKRLEWRDKTYLAPLTTVGNLPFRRMCVEYGADITCGEMALGASLIGGSKEEWALTKRHRSEKMFGVQVCGGKPAFMVPTAEAISRMIGRGENRGIDFVDLNLGCPIDLVFQKGAGSALLESAGKLGKILVGMNSALGDIPLTVKFRTGISANKSVAHKLVPRFANEWGISAMTLHGRSRQQRYSKLADWDYIKECANTLRAACSDEGIPAPPIFGNGDCYSAQSYYEEKEASGVDGVMVARGALIKPWIFTEIQERREWDISAVERLEGYRKYAEFGLDHWGADTKGVNTTRRFLCEAISFQHRYVPIGLLERMPPMMNERPPAYKGRSELETLLASPNSADWVKISEMFLGKCPDDFKFNPKHKSNSYGSEEGQG